MTDHVTHPRFTVIIPQKDRAEYLGPTLRSCMAQDYPNLEIIVSDDGSTDGSVEVVRALMAVDSRIKLFTHERHIGMRENFEFALRQAQPGYVIALGGDDGLVVGAVTRMHEILRETGRELLTWPMAGFTYPERPGGENILYIERRKDRGVRFLRSRDWLNDIARTFRYQTSECPMFYMKGVASTTLVDRVRSRTPDGSFYVCPTPDGFSGVVLAGEVEDFAFTDEPLSIGGTTHKSQGKRYQQADVESKQVAERFFVDNAQRRMHRELASQPYSPLSTLMTADYLLTARDLPGWPGEFETLSYEGLIRASFDLMATSPFETEVLVRELRILREIAVQHGLLALFDDLHARSRRRVIRAPLVHGFVITGLIRFEGSKLGVRNVYDAAQVVPFLYRVYCTLSLTSGLDFLRNSWRVFARSRSVSVEKYPRI
ncbi:MAG TPA: glycosyltransferase family A protein [Gemmatimonadaceae bacterium]|nr:glycosyltransferase family A protein [Gemmatimonadaceae bacterium]